MACTGVSGSGLVTADAAATGPPGAAAAPRRATRRPAGRQTRWQRPPPLGLRPSVAVARGRRGARMSDARGGGAGGGGGGRGVAAAVAPTPAVGGHGRALASVASPAIPRACRCAGKPPTQSTRNRRPPPPGFTPYILRNGCGGGAHPPRGGPCRGYVSALPAAVGDRVRVCGGLEGPPRRWSSAAAASTHHGAARDTSAAGIAVPVGVSCRPSPPAGLRWAPPWGRGSPARARGVASCQAALLARLVAPTPSATAADSVPSLS